MSEQNLKAIVDGIFAFLEKQYGAGHPLVDVILKEVNNLVDAAGIPALMAFLKSKGVV